MDAIYVVNFQVFVATQIKFLNIRLTDTFRPMAEADGKTLIAEIVEGIYTKGVSDNFFRLFSILLDNAVKYCDPKGTILLALSQNGKNICISVSNPCKGVDTTQLSHYFDRFYRADSSRARSTGGYGIGLSTAKAIAIRHRGRIAPRSRSGS
ncbi:MAG: GHKL domain-containing protein [Oscillospiraceae bacterium]|nr:GHKL domain-containing protein [Oscillospiraceae bacterium]